MSSAIRANIAARVQAAAEPGHRDDLRRDAAAGLGTVHGRGSRGADTQGYRAAGPALSSNPAERDARALSKRAAAGGLTPFVGREDELRSLLSRWERVLEGEGQVVTIIGEAGIGKSRLVQRFHEEIAATPHTWLECADRRRFSRTRPFMRSPTCCGRAFTGTRARHRSSAWPHWKLRSDWRELEPERGRAADRAAVGTAGRRQSIRPLSMPPDQQRKRLLATLVAWTLRRRQSATTGDRDRGSALGGPSTLEVIQLLVEQGATARLMLLYTARPEFRAPWPQRAHHTQIKLNRLSCAQRACDGRGSRRARALSDETIATVVERTGGVPLFVEELTRAVLESGEAKLTGREIPATLHDSLMARLDRLGPAKEVIQIGAVIGSEFSYELLHAVHPIAEADLQRALRSLTDAELLYVRGIAPEATYQFKHALIRDAAYEALLKSRRKELHSTVARTIDEKFPAIKETHPEVLARHWTEAGETEPAIAEWQRAGERAVERRVTRSRGKLPACPGSAQVTARIGRT